MNGSENVCVTVREREHINQNLKQALNVNLQYLYVGPTRPQHVNVSAINSTSLYVTWQPPQEKNGKILRYVIYYRGAKSDIEFLIITTASEQQKVITNLKPYTNYSVQVVANTSFGYGNRSEEQVVSTSEAGVFSLLIFTNVSIYSKCFDKAFLHIGLH